MMRLDTLPISRKRNALHPPHSLTLLRPAGNPSLDALDRAEAVDEIDSLIGDTEMAAALVDAGWTSDELRSAFSGMFGVGGGTVIVPLLILWLGYGDREATGTSMAAIVLIAALAAGLQAAHGNVDVANAALVGSPALGGAVAGTALQQRLPEKAVSLIFAALLIVIAVELVIP